MKKIGLLAILLCAGLTVKAEGICSEKLVTDSEAVLQRTIQQQSVGISTQLDVLLAEKTVLDLKLSCNTSDVNVFKDVVKNVLARLEIAKTFVNSGLVNQDYLQFVLNEKTMQKENCAEISKVISAKAAAGVVDSEDVSRITDLCEKLK